MDNLELASESATATLNHLQAALSESNQVESIIVMDLIKQAAELSNRLEALNLAISVDRMNR